MEARYFTHKYIKLYQSSQGCHGYPEIRNPVQNTNILVFLSTFQLYCYKWGKTTFWHTFWLYSNLSENFTRKPIHLNFIKKFLSLETNDTPGSASIVYLHKGGRAAWKFRHCAKVAIIRTWIDMIQLYIGVSCAYIYPSVHFYLSKTIFFHWIYYSCSLFLPLGLIEIDWNLETTFQFQGSNDNKNF